MTDDENDGFPGNHSFQTGVIALVKFPTNEFYRPAF